MALSENDLKYYRREIDEGGFGTTFDASAAWSLLDEIWRLRTARDEYKRECEAVSDFVSGTSADPFGNVEYIKRSIDHWRQRAETAERTIDRMVEENERREGGD